MKVFISILILSALVFSQCSTSEEQPEYVYTSTANTSIYNPISEKWFYGFPFFSSELTLNPDGSFTILNSGCTGHGYSEGNWINTGKELILTSYGRYKEQIQPLYSTVTRNLKTKKDKKNVKNSSLTAYTLDLSDYVSTTSINYPDTSNVYFENKRFIIGQNILIELSVDGRQTEAIYSNGKTTPHISLPKARLFKENP